MTPAATKWGSASCGYCFNLLLRKLIELTFEKLNRMYESKQKILGWCFTMVSVLYAFHFLLKFSGDNFRIFFVIISCYNMFKYENSSKKFFETFTLLCLWTVTTLSQHRETLFRVFCYWIFNFRSLIRAALRFAVEAKHFWTPKVILCFLCALKHILWNILSVASAPKVSMQSLDRIMFEWSRRVIEKNFFPSYPSTELNGESLYPFQLFSYLSVARNFPKNFLIISQLFPFSIR